MRQTFSIGFKSGDGATFLHGQHSVSGRSYRRVLLTLTCKRTAAGFSWMNGPHQKPDKINQSINHIAGHFAEVIFPLWDI